MIRSRDDKEGSSHEKDHHQVALAKVESTRRALAIDQDILRRRESLYAKDAVIIFDPEVRT